MNLTYQAVLNDPRLFDRIQAEARRERAKAVRDLVVLPITRLVTDHAPRPRLARQG